MLYRDELYRDELHRDVLSRHHPSGERTMTIDRLRTALADRYTLLRELGAGGMATVYLARDLKHDRDVAIKVLRPELAAVQPYFVDVVSRRNYDVDATDQRFLMVRSVGGQAGGNLVVTENWKGPQSQ